MITYKCKICGKQLPNKAALGGHIKSAHKNQRPGLVKHIQEPRRLQIMKNLRALMEDVAQEIKAVKAKKPHIKRQV